MMWFLVIILALCKSSFCCPYVKPSATFNLTAYGQGRWYEIARYGHEAEKGADCVTMDYVPAYEEGKLVIHATLKLIVKNKATIVLGGIHPTTDAGIIVFYTEGDAGVNVPAIIMDSDVNNYVIFYNCIPGDGNKPAQEVLWIVSRTPSISPDLKSELHKYLEETHFFKERQIIWDHLKHEDCLINEEN